MAILISFGDTKPDKELVALMIAKASAYHFVRESTLKLVYDHRWVTKEHPEAASYDRKCWHIRDDSTPSADSRGLEGCQGLLEGLYEGWLLARKQLNADALPVPKHPVTIIGRT
jgi:hypothetical protein